MIESEERLTRGALFVRICMGPMTRVFNPLIRRVAGRSHMKMAAQIHHRGRRSGKEYVTPASARLADEVFWVPLTFGTSSDWCRNVRAAGGCMIRYEGVDYVTARPVVVNRAAAFSAARGAFRIHERAMMHALRIKNFLRLDVVR
jgi:deazaflavin-dependent oxidoreductase (nitroreductase family)